MANKYTPYTPNGVALPSFTAEQPSIQDGATWFYLNDGLVAIVPLSYVVICHG